MVTTATAVDALTSLGQELQTWLDDEKAAPKRLIDWLQGYDLPDERDDAYVWLLRALPRGRHRHRYEQVLAARVAELLGERPDERPIGRRPDQLLHNLLNLAAGLRCREILAEPLWEMYQRSALQGDWLGAELRFDLRAALIHNQVDRRLDPVWRRMIAGEPDELLGGNEHLGKEGVQHMPTSDETCAFGEQTKREDRGPKKGRRANTTDSREAISSKETGKQAAETRKAVYVGAVMEGSVSSITDYGAFVDLGGLDGLLHVSEIDYGRVRHPKDVLTIGQKLEVKVIEVEPGYGGSDERISLSLRVLQPDLWQDVARKLPRGTITEGTVVRLESFGAFVELMPGVDGLVHISALGVDRRVNHPREVVDAGQEVEVKVLRVDTAARQISLSMDLDGTSEAEAGDLSNYQEAPAGSSGFGSLGEFFKTGKSVPLDERSRNDS